MNCEQCHERPARYHVTRVINGQTVADFNLCERCAAEHGELPAGPAQVVESPFSIQQFLASLLAGVGGAGTAEAAPEAEGISLLRCARCGHSYHEFARTGLLGCPECYTAFSGPLLPLIRRIHDKSRHEGKTPTRAGSGLRHRRELDDVRRELADAVAAQEFEQAAVLRDRIRNLEASGIRTPGGSGAEAKG